MECFLGLELTVSPGSVGVFSSLRINSFAWFCGCVSIRGLELRVIWLCGRISWLRIKSHLALWAYIVLRIKTIRECRLALWEASVA